MTNSIEVKYVKNSIDLEAIENLYKKKEINETFGGFRVDRLICSTYNFLITLNKKNIGLILLVKEKQNKEIVFLDIAILKKYRNKGYGQQALNIFKNKFAAQIEETIIAETKKNNIGINKIMDKIGFEQITSNVETINKFKIKNLNKK